MCAALNEKPMADSLPKSSGASIFQDGRYMPPPEDNDGKHWVRTSVLIQQDADALYAKWNDLESAPEWQEEVFEVRVTGPRTSHWVMKHDDTSVEWDSEVLNDEPGKRIAWKTVGGDLDAAGEVIFEEAAGGRGTMVTVLQEFKLGALQSTWATLTSRSPKQRVVENLRHFKALAETGEIPRSQGAPAAKRGLIGDMKRSMYGETVPTPEGKQ